MITKAAGKQGVGDEEKNSQRSHPLIDISLHAAGGALQIEAKSVAKGSRTTLAEGSTCNMDNDLRH